MAEFPTTNKPLGKPNPSLVLILMLGFALRYYGISYGFYFADEEHIVALAAKMGSGNLNPGWFLYPSGFIYVVTFLFSCYFLIGRLMGYFASVADFKYFYFTNPDKFYPIARIGNLIMGLIHIFIVYRLAGKIGRKRWAIGAAALLAITTMHIKMSFTAKPDIMMLLFVLLTVYVSVDISGEGRLRHYLMAGLFAGIAIGSKYPAAPVVLTIYVAHVYACRRKGEGGVAYVFGRYLLLAALATIAGFFISSPYSFLDLQSSLGGVKYQSQHYYMPFTSWTGPALPYHLLVSLRYGAGEIVELLGLAAIVLALVRKRREDVVVLSFPIFYLLFMGCAEIALTRYMLPVLPFLCLYTSGLITEIYDGFRDGKIGGRARPKLALALVVVLYTACVAYPLYRDVRLTRVLSKDDTRIQAAGWVKQNLPPGSSILLSGSYCRLPLLQSREQVEDLLKWRSARGEPSVRERTILANPQYPEEPAYRMIEYSPSSEENTPTFARYLPEGIAWENYDYVALCADERFSDAKFGEIVPAEVEKHLTLLKQYSPFRPGYTPEKTYDWMDDLMIPIANAPGAICPGPSIWIFKVN